MKVCSKCKIEKEDSCYYTYYHSVQQKHRTRNVCLDCTKQNSRDYKLKLKNKEITPTKRVFKPKPQSDRSNDPNYKQCKTCQKYLPLDEFYQNNIHWFVSCKKCKYKQQVQKKIDKREMGLWVNSTYPNSYVSLEQKNDVFMIMEAIGWTYNENGVWSKEGIKDKNKKWFKLKKNGKTKKNN